MYKNPFIKTNAKALEHHFYLVGEIEFYEDYLDLLDALQEASPDDEIHIHINTVGGDLAIVAQIIHHMANTKGTVITHGEGQVISGGSIIFFSGHQMEVGPFSEYLAHTASGGSAGKLPDRLEEVKHKTEYLRDIYEQVYGPFYTKKEISAILKGKEISETAKQVEARLLAALKRMEEQVDTN